MIYDNERWTDETYLILFVIQIPEGLRRFNERRIHFEHRRKFDEISHDANVSFVLERHIQIQKQVNEQRILAFERNARHEKHSQHRLQ